jgi:hypothetical protein
MRLGQLLLCAPLAWLACEGPILYQAPPCSGETGDPAAMAERRLHVRVLLDHEGREQRHELVVDTEPGRVVAVGLTPMGTLAYRIDHDALGVRIENRMGRFLGLDADLAYDAVVRGLLVGPASPPVAGDPDTTAEGGGLSVTRADCRYTARLVVVSDRPPSAVDAPDPP